MSSFYQDQSGALHEAKSRDRHSAEQKTTLRTLAFPHKVRDSHVPTMIASLIPIYTLKAIAERLTT